MSRCECYCKFCVKTPSSHYRRY